MNKMGCLPIMIIVESIIISESNLTCSVKSDQRQCLQIQNYTTNLNSSSQVIPINVSFCFNSLRFIRGLSLLRCTYIAFYCTLLQDNSMQWVNSNPMSFAKWCALLYKHEPITSSRIIGQQYYRKNVQGHLCKDFTATQVTWTNSSNCGAIIPGHGYKGYHFIMVPCYKILRMSAFLCEFIFDSYPTINIDTLNYLHISHFHCPAMWFLWEKKWVYVYISLPKLENITYVENICSMMAGSIIHWPIKDPFLNMLSNFGNYFQNKMF